MARVWKPCRVRCKLRRGIFKDEYLARIVSVDAQGRRKDVHAFVFGDTVQVERSPDSTGESSGAVKAHCVGRRKGRAAVILPQSTLENGPSILVPESELVS